MPKNKPQPSSVSAPDAPPSATRIEIIVQPDGTWSASVTMPLTEGVRVAPVLPAALATPADRTRVSTVAQDLYTAALTSLGYV